MEPSEKRSSIIRGIIALAAAGLILLKGLVPDTGFAVFLYPLIVAAIYAWLGVAFFFADMIWKLIAKPDERLFATIMLGSTVFITVALIAFYWMIKDSIGVVATTFYAIGAYAVFSIVRWFRRHAAAYYAALEAEKHHTAVD